MNSDQQTILDQFKAFLLDPTKRIARLQGPPGVGKTYLTAQIIKESNTLLDFVAEMSDRNRMYEIAITATTNKAAEALEKALNYEYEVTTIHSFLGLKVKDDYRNGKTVLTKSERYKMIFNTLIIIDESSCIGSELHNMIDQATMNCKILYIGDRYQLLDVFSVTPLVFDLPNAEDFILTKPVRYDPNSTVALLSEKLRGTIDGGTFPLIEPDGIQIFRLDGPTFRQEVINTFGPFAPKSNSKILAYTNKQVIAYNTFCRSLNYRDYLFVPGELLIANEFIEDNRGVVLCRNEDEIKVVESEPDVLYGVPCQRVMFTVEHAKNNDIKTTYVADDPAHVSALCAEYAKEHDWINFFKFKKCFADLRGKFASTVHKSQGSTFDKTFIDLEDIGKCKDRITAARLVNVAMTRSKGPVYIYGELPPRLKV